MGNGKVRDWLRGVGALIGLSNIDIRDIVRAMVDWVLRGIQSAQIWRDAEGKSGAEKLEYAAEWIADEFNIPLASESRERAIAKFVITSVVELAIRIWGEEVWFDSLMELAGLSDLG